jgi:O-antigen/teichoic acid export membrane protein
MLRNIFVVLRGTAIAQIIGVAALPIITRGFSPNAFGHFQAFQSILTVALVLCSLRYEIALLRATSQAEVHALLVLCMMLNLAISIAFFIGLMAYRYLAGLMGHAFLGFPLWCLPVALFLGGTVQILSYVLTREHCYTANANAKVGQALANAGSATGLATLAPIPSGIILADIVGRFAGTGLMIRACRSPLGGWPRASQLEVRAVAHAFRDLPIVSLPAALLNTLGSIVTPLMIYYSFDAATSGQFGLTERAISLPVALVVIAVSQVYMANLGDEIRRPGGDPRRYFRRLSLGLAGVGVLPAIIGIIAAPMLFRIVFGPGWDQAAQFARIMIPAYGFALVSGAVNMTLTVIGRTRLQLSWDGLRLAAMIALWGVAPRLGWSVNAIVGTHAAITAGFAIILIAMSYGALPRGDAASYTPDIAEDFPKELLVDPPIGDPGVTKR